MRNQWRNVSAGDTPSTRADDILERAVAEMPAREQRALLARLHDGKVGGSSVFTRARDRGHQRHRYRCPHMPETARSYRSCLVDSCSPNAFPRYDLPSFSVELRTRKPIRAGEELTIPISPSSPSPAPSVSTTARHTHSRVFVPPASSPRQHAQEAIRAGLSSLGIARLALTTRSLQTGSERTVGARSLPADSY
ncbi:hypothetical protein DAEQUDRAFT_813633 [Daedalea quercina L-15889]|uniref:Uncharacterized protein n=1 Tax=Daedalea quercina L-15889 TaxID=1314783 RepID=A0A165MYB8_9APHY|nr:hypothetical protein DAEQUDRAFT_813633 [Daedalea quercina L-15889]